MALRAGRARSLSHDLFQRMMRLAESTANTASPFLEILSSASSKTRIGRLLDFPLPMFCGPRATDDDAFASIDASVSEESRVGSRESRVVRRTPAAAPRLSQIRTCDPQIKFWR